MPKKSYIFVLIALLISGITVPSLSHAKISACVEILLPSSNRSNQTQVLVSSSGVVDQLRGDLNYRFDPKTFTVELTTVSQIGQLIQRYQNKIESIFNQFRESKFGRILFKDISEPFMHEEVRYLSFEERAFLRKVLFKSADDLSEAEKKQLADIFKKTNPQSGDTVEALFKLSLLEKLYIYAETLVRTSSGPHTPRTTPSIIYYSKKLSLKALEMGTWVFNPTPKHLRFFDRMSRSIYAKLESHPTKNIDSLLTDKEIDYLIENNLVDDAILFQHSKAGASVTRKSLRTIFNLSNQGFLKVPLIASFITLALTIPRGDFVTQEKYITSRLDEPAPSVELILDTTLFSHAAIRIGDKVYSPSQTSITVSHTDKYFGGIRENPVRELQTLKLKLTPEEVRALKKDLDAVAWQKYDNQTFFYDCATVISDLLKKNANIDIPAVIDASPALMMSYLRLSGMLEFGDSKVGDSTFVYRTEDQSKMQSLLRVAVGAVEHSAEAKIFLLAQSQIRETQSQIRAQSKLIYKSADYEAALREMIAQQKQEFLNHPDVAPNFNLIEVLAYKAKKNPSVESRNHLDSARIALSKNLQALILGEQEAFQNETDASLKIHINAKIEALMQIYNDIQI